jgi:hypothetical protein
VGDLTLASVMTEIIGPIFPPVAILGAAVESFQARDPAGAG